MKIKMIGVTFQGSVLLQLYGKEHRDVYYLVAYGGIKKLKKGGKAGGWWMEG